MGCLLHKDGEGKDHPEEAEMSLLKFCRWVCDTRANATENHGARLHVEWWTNLKAVKPEPYQMETVGAGTADVLGTRWRVS